MLHTIKNAFLTVTAAEKGAELQSVLGADGTEYLWQGDPKYWSDRALNIFPYVARLTEGRYYLDGHRYEMAIHGIAPYRDFRLVFNDGTRMVLELVSDADTLRHFPRQFAFQVIYALEENTLHISYQVENRDEKTTYFGLGGHPGFNVPLTPGKGFADYRLRFGRPCRAERVGFDETCFVTGERTPFPLEEGQYLPLRHDLFDNDAIVLAGMDAQVTLEAEDGGHRVTVCYPGMRYLGLWHWPRTDAPYVCIEPWCSLPAASGSTVVFEEQKDLIALPSGDIYRNDWTIRID